MSHEQFIMWLHGFFEISGATELNATQTQIIKDHLDEFFKKVTPEREELDLGTWTVPNTSPPVFIQPYSTCTCGHGELGKLGCPLHGTSGNNQTILC